MVFSIICDILKQFMMISRAPILILSLLFVVNYGDLLQATLLNTADFYGPYVNEEVIGKFLIA